MTRGIADLEALSITRSEAKEKTIYRSFAKRFVDTFLACCLFLCCLPIMIAAALLILLDGHGSPIFSQKRIGKNGSVFVIYKIRTMYKDAHHLGCRTDDQDDRITKLGTFLRDTKMDELPQLWNVIRGEMSFIGPRPLSVQETVDLMDNQRISSKFPGFIPSILPGMTGLEQCTRSVFQPFQHRFQLNHYYETHWSLWLDFWIIKRTLLLCPLVSTLIVVSGLLLVRLLYFWFAK